MKISISRESIKDGILALTYCDEGFAKTQSYKIPLDFFITSDSLVALAIACRPKAIEQAHFNFPVTKNVSDMLARDYRISVTSEICADSFVIGTEPLLGKLPPRERRFLSFSGGVDSLAARYLIGQDAELLSVDYGERFGRERDFFNKWQTLVIDTNFRDKPFVENVDWRFMSAGAILMSDYLGIGTLIFGTVLEASPFWFNTTPRGAFEEARHYQSFAVARIKLGQSVTSLSEYGTTKVAHCYGEEILDASIKSAADDNTSKKLRKLLLKKIVACEPITERWVIENKPNSISTSGKSFAEDILGLYFAYKLGQQFTNDHILEMDEKFSNFSKFADMAFFEKYNQFNLSSTPIDLKAKFISIFDNIGLLPYSDADIASLQRVREFLSSRFKFKA